MDIQIVAFPQNGILRDPGTAELLDEALAAGADLIGGLDPAGIDGDVKGHLDVVFGLAERHGVGVDIHLHDAGALGCFELRDIAARTIATGLQGRVAVSHAFALGSDDTADVEATLAAARARQGCHYDERARILSQCRQSRDCMQQASCCSQVPTTSGIVGHPTATATCWSGQCSLATGKA